MKKNKTIPTSSLIIATYNWPQALALSLRSAVAQSVLPDEIIVADDGSGKETEAVISEFKEISPVPVKHVWHEDRGFRLAAIRNKAITAASGEYIIQVDGDIIMHPKFIEDHLRFSSPNSFVRASRIYINETLSKKMLATNTITVNIFKKGISNFFSAVHLPLLWALYETSYKNSGDERWEIHGCNMAFWKADIMEVNGYNEEFIGWGPEDKELVVRLLNAGKVKRFIKAGAIAFHLHHKENSKPNLVYNENLLRKAIQSSSNYCVAGIQKVIDKCQKNIP